MGLSTMMDISKSLPPINEGPSKQSATDLEDIDYNNNKLSVSKLRKVSSTVSFQPPKTPGSLPRRPSDTMINRLNQQTSSNLKVCTLNRPASDDSLSSSSNIASDFSSENEASRNSSITDESISDSTLEVRSSKQQQHPLYLTATSKSHSTSTLVSSQSPIRQSLKVKTSPSITPNHSSTTLNRLTPSQRYRLKRQNSKLTLKNREKLYDDMTAQGLGQDHEDEADLIWNVPFTKGAASIFSSTAGKSSTLINKIFDQSPILMPMSPLPGSVSAPSSPMLNRTTSAKRSFYNLPTEAASISEFYQASSASYFQKQLKERQNSSTNLPSYIQEASQVGLEDTSLVSEEKLHALSSSRPIWLPPKSAGENKKHVQDINQVFEDSVRFEKQLKQKQELQNEKMSKYSKRWMDVSQHSKIYKYSTECRRLVFKTAIPQELRLKIWKSFLERDQPVSSETYNELNAKLQSFKDFPLSKTEEISLLIKPFKKNGTDNLLQTMEHLMKLKMLSSTGLNSNSDHIVLYALLSMNFATMEAFELLTLINEKVFSKTNISKFTSKLQTNHTFKRLLGSEEFKGDLETLSFSQMYQILLNLILNGKTTIVENLLDIFVVYQGEYKPMMAVFVTILRDYHFGFSSLSLLNKSHGVKLYVNEDSSFIERVYSYLKKF
ncbi:hypothetical protein WICPIJ_001722 [Wickerhamomyces pijperi]|uniref:Rab-GAP TBC domain-containing protein n=1 Tax=Wickerhamomyces pijperi TaxID=599730 RepID=A0A9P8QD48_WICPI|nr:hypothetical protein WICPIJ_001722 [Wickerhamomyces pijperi]